MKHRMAVWADWTQIGDRVDVMNAIGLCEWLEVMDVNETKPKLPIVKTEIKTAYGAQESIMTDAGISRFGVPLDCINNDREPAPFDHVSRRFTREQ